MSDTIRAKFSCRLIEAQYGGTWRIVFEPVYSGSAENREFFQWTPGGRIELAVVGSSTAAQFNEGHDYYVDFTPAKEPQP